MIGYKGLNKQIANQKLLLPSLDSSKYAKIAILSPEELYQSINGLDTITIGKSSIKGDIIRISGVMNNIVGEDKKFTNISFEAELKAEDNNLWVKNISLDQHKTLTSVLQSILGKNNRSLTTTYQYIKENLSFYMDTASELSLCDSISNKFSVANLVKCSDKYVYLKKQDNGAPTKYEFRIKNYGIVNFKISDSALNQELHEKLSHMDINQITLPNVLVYAFNYKIPQEE
ncbi:MAG: hypothetical protein GXP45_06295 [bacterium]|nr:hypothetical protein [bacterium]